MTHFSNYKKFGSCPKQWQHVLLIISDWILAQGSFLGTGAQQLFNMTYHIKPIAVQCFEVLPLKIGWCISDYSVKTFDHIERVVIGMLQWDVWAPLATLRCDLERLGYRVGNCALFLRYVCITSMLSLITFSTAVYHKFQMTAILTRGCREFYNLLAREPTVAVGCHNSNMTVNLIGTGLNDCRNPYLVLIYIGCQLDEMQVFLVTTSKLYVWFKCLFCSCWYFQIVFQMFILKINYLPHTY